MNLDKRLQEIILDLFGDSPEPDDKEITDFYVAAIHLAFKDAGYLSPAEWYQRFDEAWSNIYLEKHDALSASEWIEAAKIASGIEEDSSEQ